jgi:hypothetical protein
MEGFGLGDTGGFLRFSGIMKAMRVPLLAKCQLVGELTIIDYRLDVLIEHSYCK